MFIKPEKNNLKCILPVRDIKTGSFSVVVVVRTRTGFVICI